MKPVDLETSLIEGRQRELNAMKPSLNGADERAIYEALKADFPKEAFSKDTSRGFALTSVKAQYVVERLNDVLGFMNWSHGGEHKLTDDGSGVLFHGALVVSINGKQNRFFSTGYAKLGKNLGDAYKSAKTDSLSKAASQIGVANDTFKGLIDPETFEKVVKGKTLNVISESSESISDAPAPFKTRTKRSRRSAEIAEDSSGDDI